MIKSVYFLLSIIAIVTTLHAAERPKTPIMGWSSWNHFRIDINEVVIQGQASSMIASGMRDAGYQYVNIDDGFLAAVMTSGISTATQTDFPVA